eukprot:7388887-Prymnesium_polylepis.2
MPQVRARISVLNGASRHDGPSQCHTHTRTRGGTSGSRTQRRTARLHAGPLLRDEVDGAGVVCEQGRAQHATSGTLRGGMLRGRQFEREVLPGQEMARHAMPSCL